MASKDSKDKRANGSAADDAEFEKLLDEMDELGRQADALRKKVNHLIDEMRENDVPPEEEVDEEVDGVAVDADNAAEDEADNVTSDNGADGVVMEDEGESNFAALEDDVDSAGEDEPDAA